MVRSSAEPHSKPLSNHCGNDRKRLSCLVCATKTDLFKEAGVGYYMKKVLIVGHCNVDHPQITSLIENNFSAEVTRVKLLKKAIGYLEKQDYDLVIINRIGAFDQEDGIELIKEIKKDGRFKPSVMMVTNYKDQMDKAIESGAVPGYSKEKLYDKETIELLGEYLG
ncbi:MAG: Response regulator receiver domain protein [Candidatus Scalindua rubra]|uniref:Response regulator receiver domain protein n=1 Tax=Candidatus Scalindua rubra TaxID=1872076 RepID=A0A1E3XG59_9BACT|nr:MAG: Response regulator receiver domain protein [Candidatus Scalindua rubra]